MPLDTINTFIYSVCVQYHLEDDIETLFGFELHVMSQFMASATLKEKQSDGNKRVLGGVTVLCARNRWYTAQDTQWGQVTQQQITFLIAHLRECFPNGLPTNKE